MTDAAAVYPGGWRITNMFVSHEMVTNARFNRGGEVYPVAVTPLEERLTGGVAYSKRQASQRSG